MKPDQNKFSNKEIANILRNIAAVYLLKNENRFKIVAYENAADAVEQLNRELKDIWQEGKMNIPGIGKSIGSNLDEYFKTGKSKHFESVLSRVPETVFILMTLSKIGPKKAYKLVQNLNLINPKTVLKDLQKACEQNKVAALDTFGKKSQEEIMNSIKLYEKRSSKSGRMPFPYAYRLAKEIEAYLKKIPTIKRIETLGSLRRKVATIGDIDIAVQVEETKEIKANKIYKEIINHFIKFPKVISIESSGDNKSSVIVSPNIRVDLRVQEESSFGAMLQYFTGSKGHNIKLREFGLKQGVSLNEWGIKNVKTSSFAKASKDREKLKLFNSEEKFYNSIGLQYIPPELREGTNEIELAKLNKIPQLVEIKDIRGDLHIHSSYNLNPSHDSGKNSYQEILQKADELEYEYVGFTDHNPRQSGQSENQIVEIMKKRQKDIELIRSKQKTNVKCFIGLETDILPDGRIALPEKAIEFVDFLIVSIHSVFNMNIKKMTERVLNALSFPKVKILAHPTGRLLDSREGFELEWEQIFEFSSKKNIALEINSWPERLDLPDSLVREALDYKIKFAIDTDAHANSHMDGMFYGISVARRGWCTKDDIINTRSYTDFKNWLTQ